MDHVDLVIAIFDETSSKTPRRLQELLLLRASTAMDGFGSRLAN